MLRSRAVAKVKPSSSYSTVLILGIGKGFLINLLLTSRKLLRKRTVLFFFGTIKDGDADSEWCCRSSTPSLHSLSISLMRTSLCIFGTGKAWPWYGDAPSFNWKETGLVFQSPNVPSKSDSNLTRSCSNFSDGRHLDACNCSSQLTGDLLWHIWHLVYTLHVW